MDGVSATSASNALQGVTGSSATSDTQKAADAGNKEAQSKVTDAM